MSNIPPGVANAFRISTTITAVRRGSSSTGSGRAVSLTMLSSRAGRERNHSAGGWGGDVDSATVPGTRKAVIPTASDPEGPVPRDIDHLVLAVRDINAARATYDRLGFTLTPVARHPFGTENSLVQMQGSYLELLAVADPAAIVEATETRFSFGAFNRDYLKSREGLSMLVLRSADAT